jgi:nicotinic acid mononucleotide adenylyltransferase
MLWKDNQGHWLVSTPSLEKAVRLESSLGLPHDEQRLLCERVAAAFRFMNCPSELDVVGAPEIFFKQSIEQLGIFYPGSFNPWHLGHRAVTELCPHPVIVVPDRNPWKELRFADGPWDRCLKIALALKETKHSVYPGFAYGDRANPTYDWMKMVTLPKRALLLGDDAFLSLNRWHRFSDLLQELVAIYVAPRGESGEELERQRERVLERAPALRVHFLANHDYEDLASSKLRKN